MDAVLSYAWRRNHHPQQQQQQHQSPKDISPETPRRRHTDRNESTSGAAETFATPPEEDVEQRQNLAQSEPASESASAPMPMSIPALFSPVNSSSHASSNSAGADGAATPATPEGLRPRPTVSAMRRILNLHLGTPIPPPSRPPPTSWLRDNATSSQNVATTPDALMRQIVPVMNDQPCHDGRSNDRYAAIEHCSNVAPANNVTTSLVPLLPSQQFIADTVSISSNHSLSMSALTYSPAANFTGICLPQSHQPRKGLSTRKSKKNVTVATTTNNGIGFASPPMSFGSPTFFPASVSRGVATMTPTPRGVGDGTNVALSPSLTMSGAKTAVGLLVAESLEISKSCGHDDFGITSTPIPTTATEQSERGFTGIAMSPNLTLSGAKTAVGLATVESFDNKDESMLGSCDGIALTPNLTMSGAKTAVGLAVAESFDRDESSGGSGVAGARSNSNSSSSSNSLTRVAAVVLKDKSNNVQSDGAKSCEQVALLPPRDWESDDASSVGGGRGGGWFSPRDPFPATSAVKKGEQKQSQPRTIPHAPSDASSLYEEEGERLRQQSSRSAASSTITTPRANRSKSTDQTTSTAGKTWEHYQQFYEDEDSDFDDGDDDESDFDGDNDACEYTALHRPMLELHGSVDVSRDISFSSRQGFLSGQERGQGRSTSKGSAAVAYDFGKLEGIESNGGLASLDGSSIRPNPSMDDGFGAVGNLPLSPPQIPLPARREVNYLPQSPPSLPNGSRHELDVLPRSPPAVSSNVLSDEEIDAKYQRQMEIPREADMPSIVFGLDPNVSALSHATGMMSALMGGELDANADLLPKMEEEEDDSQRFHTYATDDALVKRKRLCQVRAAKETQLKEVVEQLRDAPAVVRSICSSKGMLGEAATSIFSGYEASVQSSILNEFDSLLTFVFDDDHTREAVRFVQALVASAPEPLVTSSGSKGPSPSPSALETPRNVPLASNTSAGTYWRANDDLLRALGIGGYSSPDVVVDRGGDTSLFTLPTNSATPNMSNQSMATTITSEPNSSNDRSDKNGPSTYRRLCFTVEAVILLLQQIAVAAFRLPEERLRDDTIWAASVEEIKRGYRYLMQISEADLRDLQAAFTLQECTPLPLEKHQKKCNNAGVPPVLNRGGGINSTNQLIDSSKRLDLRSPDAARTVDGEINNPPPVVRAMAAFEANSSPRPVVPTVSEEPEEESGEGDDNGYAGDREGYHALESDSDSVVTSEPRDLLTSFEDEVDDSNCEHNASDLTPNTPMLQEVGDADDEESHVDGHVENSFVSANGSQDHLLAGEDLRRLCFDTSTMDNREEGGNDEDCGREGPSEHTGTGRPSEMSV